MVVFTVDFALTLGACSSRRGEPQFGKILQNMLNDRGFARARRSRYDDYFACHIRLNLDGKDTQYSRNGNIKKAKNPQNFIFQRTY
jgi:hypothetical protein